MNAVKQNQSVVLNWNIASEENLKGFYIQKQTTETWKTIGFIAANAALNYSFIDHNPVIGTNYYRLKIADKDGTLNISKVVTADFEKNIQINISPNPVTSMLTINGLNAGEKANFNIVNTSGEIVQSNFTFNNQFQWNLSNLVNGNYFLLIYQNNKLVSVNKFIKQ